MLNGTVIQNSHLGSYSYTTVCTQSSIFGYHPSILNLIPDRIFRKIMHYTAILLANHIHVALQYHCRSVFIPFGGFFGNKNITDPVGFTLEISIGSKFLQKCDNMLLMA